MPDGNEFVYLLRLAKQYNPWYLAGDFSFSFAGNEHWLFNHLFGLFAVGLSIEMLGWAGRIACWLAIVYGLFRLGKHWDISYRAVCIAIFIWLCFGQTIVNDEWMLGGFEAKSVAYACLIFALDGFCRKKYTLAAILAGLTFSFHPAVGLWAILAIGSGLLAAKTEIVDIIKVVVITGLFSLPGIVPLLTNGLTHASDDDWKFIALVRAPAVFDILAWSKSSIILLWLMFAFCFAAYKLRETEFKFNFLHVFLVALGGFFIVGATFRITEHYEFARLMPMRLFPVFATLFFFFTFARVWKQRSFSAVLAGLAIIITMLTIVRHNPVGFAFEQIKANYRSWTQTKDDATRVFEWVEQNTPRDSVIIAPPWRRDYWYRAGRPQVASFTFPTYENLREWRTRVKRMIGEKPMAAGERTPEDMAPAYRAMNFDEIDAMSLEYRADYLISDGEYPYPVVFRSGQWKLFLLPKK